MPSTAAHTLTNSGCSIPLDVTGDSTANNAKIIQASATGGTDQRWKATKVSDYISTRRRPERRTSS